MQIGVKQAKDQFRKLLVRAAAGEEIIITRKGVPIARLIRPDSAPKEPKLGLLGDEIRNVPGFDAPLSGDALDDFLEPKTKRKKRKST